MGENKKNAGHPPIYSKELADQVCALIAEGYTLRQIGKIDGMPSHETIRKWCMHEKEFLGQYARAKRAQMDSFAEEIVDIADDGSNDWLERETRNGETYTVVDREAVERSRLRIETRKWLMGKIKPKKYGDKNTTEHKGKISVENIDDAKAALLRGIVSTSSSGGADQASECPDGSRSEDSAS